MSARMQGDRRLAWVLGVMVAITATPAVAAGPCMSAGIHVAAEGEVEAQDVKDGAGRATTAYLLKLPLPICLSGADKKDNVAASDTIELTSQKPELLESLADFVGKRALVQGKPSGARSARRHAPIVMDISAIDPD